MVSRAFKPICQAQINICEYCPYNNRVTQLCIPKISPAKVGSAQLGHLKLCVTEVRPSEIRPAEDAGDWLR